MDPSDTFTLRVGIALSGLDILDCWVAFMELGGTSSYLDYSNAVTSGHPMTDMDHDRAAQALNERLRDRGLGQPVAYHWEVSTA